jgi:cyclase
MATVENRKTRLEWVKRVVDVVTIPFAVGGGIGNLNDMQELFDMGVNKVSINTSAVRNPDLISEASSKFGKKRLVVAIDGKKNPAGSTAPRLEVVVKSGEEALSGRNRWRSSVPERYFLPVKTPMGPRKGMISR